LEIAASLWQRADVFCDACLVRMSEIHSDCAIWTLDSDFRVYRRSGRQSIPLLIPD